METIEISIGNSIRKICPHLVLGVIEAKVTNSLYNSDLWDEVQRITARVRNSWTFEDIRDQEQIAATRKMYSACGKDPSRYRPSAEALMRRIVKGQDLYQISTLVDLINLTSLRWGYSIGGFDVSRIEGSLEMGLGKKDEIYNAIGRGVLNIENLPVLRDSKGPVGSPTSDEERTSIQIGTSHLLMVIYAFDGTGPLGDCMHYATELLNRHAGATKIYTDTITQVIG